MSSQNRGCNLKYSKAEYKVTDIVSLPAHFELPSVPIIWDDDREEDTQPLEANQEADVHTAKTDQARDAGFPAPQQPPQLKHADTLDNFRNVYITRPPPIMLRDSSKTWYTFPWRIAQSIEVRKV